jgi:large subunit ribosomal protein L33
MLAKAAFASDIRARTRTNPGGRIALPEQRKDGHMPREIVQLQCTICKDKNYSTTKNRKTTTERLEFSKFCRKCRKHTDHREVK